MSTCAPTRWRVGHPTGRRRDGAARNGAAAGDYAVERRRSFHCCYGCCYCCHEYCFCSYRCCGGGDCYGYWRRCRRQRRRRWGRWWWEWRRQRVRQDDGCGSAATPAAAAGAHVWHALDNSLLARTDPGCLPNTHIAAFDFDGTLQTTRSGVKYYLAKGLSDFIMWSPEAGSG